MDEDDVKIKICSKYYLYILMTSLFFILKSSILGFSEIDIDTNTNIFGINVILKEHIFIKIFLEYFGYIFFGLIFLFIFYKKQFKQESNTQLERKNSFLFGDFKIQKRALILLLIACTFFAIQLIVRSILFFFNTWKLDMWIFNIIFINIFMKYIMNIPIYKHQLYILIFIFSANIILIIVSSSIKYDGKDLSFYESLIEIYEGPACIIIFYIIYLILSALICSSQVFQKKLMDSYYISPLTIIFVIGIISAFFTLIVLIITSSVNCGEYFSNIDICQISYTNFKNNNTFIDNFSIYLKKMNDKHKMDNKGFYIEIFLVYPFYSFACFIKYFYETLVVLYLNPNFVVISDIIYYSIRMVIILIYNPSDITTYLTLFGEIIALSGYCFYLEIFEIKFCGLNRDTKNKISERGILERINDKKINIDEEEDDIRDENTYDEENKIKEDNEVYN